jgi:hypothetical protein
MGTKFGDHSGQAFLPDPAPLSPCQSRMVLIFVAVFHLAESFSSSILDVDLNMA